MTSAEQGRRTVAENSRFRNPRRWREVVEPVFPGALGKLSASMGAELPVPLRASFEDITTPTINSWRIARFRETFKTWEKVCDYIGLPAKSRKKVFGPMMEQIINWGINPEFDKKGGVPVGAAIRIVNYPDYRFDDDVRTPLSNLGFDMLYADRFGIVQEDGQSRNVVEARFSWSQAPTYI